MAGSGCPRPCPGSCWGPVQLGNIPAGLSPDGGAWRHEGLVSGEAALPLAASAAQRDAGCPSNAVLFFPCPERAEPLRLSLTGPGGPCCSESTRSSIPPRKEMKESPRRPQVLPSPHTQLLAGAGLTPQVKPQQCRPGTGDAARGNGRCCPGGPSQAMLPGSGRGLSPAPKLQVVNAPQRVPPALLLPARVLQELHKLIPPLPGLCHAEPRHG